MSENRVQNDLVLSPGEFAYTQDITSGALQCHTGPRVLNTTGQEYPVKIDQKTGRLQKVNLTDATQQNVLAQQGQYVLLSNPARERTADGSSKQPDIKSKSLAAELDMGQKVIIQGPVTFALWPGQSAEVIDGHNLRSNQYLRIRIRDEKAAQANWTKGVIKAATTDADPSDKKGSKEKARKSLFDKVPDDLAVGKEYIVRGDEFSFYIPPTGVEVVKDENGGYVRDAVTLERLEYCILVDENGTKSYPRGPRVVFPLPTERFYEETGKDGRHIVFQPIELNEIQGIHVKVNSDYEDEDGTKHKEGEELFITGAQTPIYFPRTEHSIVTYDRKHKTFATAVPAGEGRYVLERKTGVIETVRGPMMLLPDPRSQVIVNRALTERQCKLWYPGNLEAEKYNSALRELSRATSSTRGAITEGEVLRSKKIRTTPMTEAAGFADKSTTHSDTMAIGVEEFERASTYTEPRTLTLDTKFRGTPTIDIWTGYAVMVVTVRDDIEVKRRVEVGPKRLLLEYDETLETLSMSTGKPKNTDSLIQTVYLRVKNNQISDVIAAETRDHVQVTFKVSLRGDFTGDANKWFDAENYVKLVCDHVRSVVKGIVRQKTIEELYADPTSVLRDAVLGPKGEKGESRKGMLFDENGFHLTEVELLGFTVGDDKIAKILEGTQHQVVESNISLALSEKKLEIQKRQELINRELAEAKAETHRVEATLNADTQKFNAQLESERVARELKLELERLNASIEGLKEKERALAQEQALLNSKQEQELARRRQAHDLEQFISKAAQELALARDQAQTEAVVERFRAASGPFAEALVALGNQDTLVKIAEAQGVANYIGGPNLVEALRSIFTGTPMQAVVEGVITKAQTKNGQPEKRS